MSCYASSKDREKAIFEYIQQLEQKLAELEKDALDNQEKLNASIQDKIAKLAEAEKQNEWVSVEDRLPEELYEIFLVQCKDDNERVGFYFRTTLWLKEAGWQTEHPVTHWKSILPPQEKE